MPAPLSQDLRQRIVGTYHKGNLSTEQVADRFGVGHATVTRLLRLERDTGTTQAKPHGGGVPARITEADRERLEAYLAENPSLTQTELAERFAQDTGRRVSQRTMSRVLARLGITRKKDQLRQPA